MSPLNEDPIRDLLNKLFGKKSDADTGSEDNMDNVANTGDITPGQSYSGAASFADKYDRSPIKTYDLPPAKDPEPFDLGTTEKERAANAARDSLRDLFKRDGERTPVKVNTSPDSKSKYTGVTKAVDDAATWVGDKVDQGWGAVKDYFNNPEPAQAEPAADDESGWLDGVVDRYKRFYGAGDKEATPKPVPKPADADAARSADDALDRLMADPEFRKMLDQ